MLKSLLPFTLLWMLPGLLMAYTVSVKGIVYDSHHRGVPGIAVKVMSVVNDPVMVDSILITDGDGIFELQLEMPDDVSKGTLLLSIDGCDHAKRVVFHPNQSNHSVLLRDCHVNDGCDVRILAEKLDDSSFLLSANAKGMEAFSFYWNTGDTAKQIMVKESGSYWVIATSSDGCQARDNIYLRSDKQCKTEIHLLPSANASEPFTLVARTKGQRPFTFSWSTGDTTERILVSESGEYCVTVVDATGCKSEDCQMSREPSCETVIHAVRLGSNTDAAGLQLIARTKGRPPFTFQWNTGDSTQLVNVDSAGEYCVEVTDAFGCVSSACFVVDPSKDCKTKISLLPDFTSSTPGFHLISRTHGRPPFKYHWTTGDTTNSIHVSEIGEYCVEVTDANECISKDCINLSPIASECGVKIDRSPGGNLFAQPRGYPPFQFKWSTGDTIRLIHPDSSGEYCVSVTNAFGCTSETCILVETNTDHCRMKIQKRALPDQDGYELTANVSNNQDYKFIWNTGDTTASIVVSEDGEYCVEALGALCDLKTCIDVKFSQGAAFSDLAIDQLGMKPAAIQEIELMAAPNPVVNVLHISWKTAPGLRASQIIITDLNGLPVIRRDISTQNTYDNLSLDIQALQPGIYFVQLTGNQINKQIKLVKSQ